MRGADTLTAGVPFANEPLPGSSIPGAPTASSGYGGGDGSPTPSIAPLFVRLDVTYLAQDFSLFQPVIDPDPWPSGNPWPTLQRFDFLAHASSDRRGSGCLS